MFNTSINEINRQTWLKNTLSGLPAGAVGNLRTNSCGHLEYVSQDFCQHEGQERDAPADGLQSKSWDTSRIDLVSDIAAIPESDCSFDAILCSEVLEHVPEPTGVDMVVPCQRQTQMLADQAQLPRHTQVLRSYDAAQSASPFG